MKLTLRRIVAPFVLLVALWNLVTMSVDIGTQIFIGVFEAERITPYSNVHLSEEAAEGIYSPLTDPVFILYISLVGIVAFGFSSFFAAWGASKQELILSAIPGIVGLLILLFPHRDIWFQSYPGSFRNALFIELIIYIACILFGLYGSKMLSKRRLAESNG